MNKGEPGTEVAVFSVKPPDEALGDSVKTTGRSDTVWGHPRLASVCCLCGVKTC